MQDFYAIGHITNDLNPHPHVSGSVAYAAVMAKQFGYKPTIITKCKVDHPYIRDLENLGIKVINLPIRNSIFGDALTTFENVFDSNGRRKQKVSNIQEKIDIKDLNYFPKISSSAIVLVGSVISEISVDLINFLDKKYKTNFVCQGCFRSVDVNGYIHASKWPDLEKLRSIHLISISDEDITIEGKINYSILSQVKKLADITLYTLGEKGSIIYTKNGTEDIIKPFKLSTNEVIELSGSGDIYTTAYILALNKNHDVKEAAVVASLVAALKIRAGCNKDNYGLKSCSSKKDIDLFINKNKERFFAFLESNKLLTDTNIINSL